MQRRREVQRLLTEIIDVLHYLDLWQSAAPAAEAFNSIQPFCLDSMEPIQWLQWVLIPRLSALLEAGLPLPDKFAITAYFEEALEQEYPSLLVLLSGLDQLLHVSEQ